MRLSGKRALVTGAGSGIGAAIAERFAREGAEVALLGRTATKLEEIAGRIERNSGRAIIVPADLSDPESAVSAMDTIREGLGPIDLLVNCAGTFAAGGARDIGLDDWESMLRINLTAPFWLSRCALSHFAERGGGVILNISSTLAERPVPASLAYSVSKAGLEMMTRCLALDHGAENIRVNAISPAIVATPIHGTAMPPDAVEAMYAHIAPLHPLQRIGKPEDIAAAAVHLCSDEASWTTGSIFVVDGGLSLAGP